MSTITVISKVDGFHPVSGNHLVAGEKYAINKDEFSDEIFSCEPENSDVKLKTEGGVE